MDFNDTNKGINNFEDDINSIELYFNDNINDLNDEQVRESDVIAVKKELNEEDKKLTSLYLKDEQVDTFLDIDEKDTDFLLKDIENLNIISEVNKVAIQNEIQNN